MKIRTSFISNSSTTSFIIYGAHFREGAFDSEEYEDWDQDYLYEAAGKLGLELHHAGEEEWGYYLGKNLKAISDDETGRDFKEGIKSLVQEFLKDVKHEDVHHTFGVFAETYAS